MLILNMVHGGTASHASNLDPKKDQQDSGLNMRLCPIVPRCELTQSVLPMRMILVKVTSKNQVAANQDGLRHSAHGEK